MLDFDHASLYGATTENLSKAVHRNSERFPERFMFQLTHATESVEIAALCERILRLELNAKENLEAASGLSEDMRREIGLIYDAIGALSVRTPDIRNRQPIDFEK